MTTNPPPDVIVVGSGATGGWAAMDLAARGLRVLVLEAGPEAAPIDPMSLVTRQRAKKPPAWVERQRTQATCHACVASTRHLFVDDVDHPYTTPEHQPFDWIRGRQVGGRSITWGGACYRQSELDFDGSADGVIPRWPIRYSELAPFYDRVEDFIALIGTREGIAHVPDGVCTEPSELTAGEAAVRAAIEERWPDRRVIPGRSARRTPVPSGWPQWSSPGSSLSVALASRNVTLRANAAVSRVLVDHETGRARGVSFVDRTTKAVHEVFAPFVMLCASSLETVRILLSSSSPARPEGIGSSSSALGRFVMDHVYSGALHGTYAGMSGLAEVDQPRAVGAYIPRFQNLPREAKASTEPFAFIGGYQLHLRISALYTRAMVGDDADTAALIARTPAQALIFGFGEMLPRFENRVSLRHDVRDSLGLPTLRIECAHGENEHAIFQHMIGTISEVARAGGIALEQPLPASLAPPGRAVHEVGGARMGGDATSSVVDAHNRAWECPNLYVADGAAFVTLPCQNPTLTMMALTARACVDVARAWKRG